MNILLPWHNTGFDYLQEDDEKDTENTVEEMLCTILYPENLDKSRFSDLKKCVENDYVLNKAEQPRTVTPMKSLLLNYKPNYKSGRN